MKGHLAKGEPVMWVPMEKGNSHTPYGPRSCPGGGHFDHHEPIVGLGSDFELNDPEVHDDDWIVHFSDYDLQPCYRKISSLDDDFRMEGNCGAAREDKRQMFPCFYREVTYGMSVTGLQLKVPTLRVFLDVDQPYEPNVRLSESASWLRGTVRVQGLQPGARYALYRFDGTEALPEDDLDSAAHGRKVRFVAEAETWTYEDPVEFLSSSAVYYVAVPEAHVDGDIAAATALEASAPRSSPISGDEGEALEAATWWLRRAPTWPALVRVGVRGFMGNARYQGGSSLEDIMSLVPELLSQQPSGALILVAPLLASAAAFVAVVTGALRVWRRHSRGAIVERPALG